MFHHRGQPENRLFIGYGFLGGIKAGGVDFIGPSDEIAHVIAANSKMLEGNVGNELGAGAIARIVENLGALSQGRALGRSGAAYSHVPLLGGAKTRNMMVEIPSEALRWGVAEV